ncbi:rCG52791, isoform CRA_a [Rattus norvegicus]|uniref:RCG52791, isoform CRA_a n=1 Tax=Rattus norvegicus TaxID=10116 RepID=A6IRQ6_RAT|nr:rCG52791, isoform CRA_a [Rattus norvegicus]
MGQQLHRSPQLPPLRAADPVPLSLLWSPAGHLPDVPNSHEPSALLPGQGDGHPGGCARCGLPDSTLPADADPGPICEQGGALLREQADLQLTEILLPASRKLGLEV